LQNGNSHFSLQIPESPKIIPVSGHIVQQGIKYFKLESSSSEDVEESAEDNGDELNLPELDE